MMALSTHSIHMKITKTFSVMMFVLSLWAVPAHTDTTFSGELFVKVAKPTGIKFATSRQGEALSGGAIDFGILTMEPQSKLFFPLGACPDASQYCFKAAVFMEPERVMGDFTLTVRYVEGSNPNASTNRGGLGKKIGMSIDQCKFFAPYTCSSSQEATGLEGFKSGSTKVLTKTTDYFEFNFFFPDGNNGLEPFTIFDKPGVYSGTILVTGTVK